MSLRSSLIVSISLIMLVTLLFGAALSYVNARAKIQTEMHAAVNVGARAARNAIDKILTTDTPARSLKILVSDFDDNRHLRATWINTSALPVASSIPAEPSSAAPKWLRYLIRQDEHSVRVPLPPELQNFGHIAIQSDSANEIAEIWQDTSTTLLILGLFCGLVIALVYWMLNISMRHLNKLASAFSQVGSTQQVPRINERGAVELIKVYHGFNQMVDRLGRAETTNKRLAEQIASIQEEERAELARDLHDEVGPFLFSVDVDIAAAQNVLESSPPNDIKNRLGKVRDAVKHMQDHVKDLLGRLRTEALIDVGLEHALDNLLEFWRGRHPHITFTANVPQNSFGEIIDRTIYRVVQESLSNAVRHADPRNVNIAITNSANGMISVAIDDDGQGMTTNTPHSGYGITGMTERLQALGGTLSVKNNPGGKGVCVTATLPQKDQIAPSENLT